jgi:hypothetical protein
LWQLGQFSILFCKKEKVVNKRIYIKRNEKTPRLPQLPQKPLETRMNKGSPVCGKLKN